METIGIMYHDVIDSGDRASSGFAGAGADIYKISARDFQLHLDHIRSRGISPELITHVNASDDQRHVFITFDDGGESAYNCASDLLEKCGWRGHFFVATEFIGRPGFLKPEQIRELHKRGHVIGSHSDTHPTRMAKCTRDEMLSEWNESVRKISDITGSRVTTASVPGGYFSVQVAETASESGIEYLFNSEPVTRNYSVDNCQVVGRFTIQQGISQTKFEKLVSGDKFYRLEEYLRWNTKKAAKRFGGGLYLDLRDRFFDRRSAN